MINLFWQIVKFITFLITVKKAVFKSIEQKPEHEEVIITAKPAEEKPKPEAAVIEVPQKQEIIEDSDDAFFKGIGYGLGITAGLFAAVYIINRYIVPSYSKPPKALPGDTGNFKVDEGILSYYQDGEGDPLILLHSINAGASSHEMEEVFNYYRYKRAVYSLDLLGYGLSERPDIRYSPSLYIKHIKEFAEHVKTKHNKKPDIMALSLSTEYVLKLAELDPELFNRIILISPTGLENNVSRLKYNINKLAIFMFKFPVLGQGLFNLLTTRSAMKKYLTDNIFVDPRHLSFLMLQHYYYTTHVEGAKNSPSYFVAGELFVDNIFQSYLNLNVPALIIRGTAKETVTRYDAIDTVTQENKKIRDTIIENGGLLPHIEKPNEFFIVTDKYLG
jgi:pimeloyl-ACP methyl ester carboxylesterase